MKFNVLNPRGRDPEQHFPDGAGKPGQAGHAPINFHAYAACTGGAFHVDARNCVEEQRPVLVLIRHRLRQTLKVVDQLRSAGLRCFVCWKETGLQQVAAQLSSPSRLALFRDIVAAADGVLTPNDELVPLYQWAAGDKPVHFVPTPYPVEQSQWDFSQPLSERAGLFLGTRSFKSLYRTHLSLLALAATLVRRHDCRLTVINTEGRDGRRLIDAFEIPSTNMEVCEPRPYTAYLELMASHRLVLQWDLGAVPGQVAGDALLCRMPCVGGNGVNERLAFTESCGGGRSGESLGLLASRLLDDDEYWLDQVARSQDRAAERLSYRVVARRLSEIVAD